MYTRVLTWQHAKNIDDGVSYLRPWGTVSRVASGCRGYAVMKRGANVVTSNLAVGMAAALATGGLLGPSRNKVTCGGCGTKYLLG